MNWTRYHQSIIISQFSLTMLFISENHFIPFIFVRAVKNISDIISSVWSLCIIMGEAKSNWHTEMKLHNWYFMLNYHEQYSNAH